MNLIIILGYKLKQFSFHSTGKEAKESPEWDGADSRLHSWQHFIKSDAIQNECVKKQLNPNKIFSLVTVVVFQSLSHVQLSVTPWIAACQTLLSFTISWSFLKLMSIESVMPSNHLIFCHPLLLPLQSFPASGSFQMSQFFASGGQSIGVSASTSAFPMNIQDWFSLGWARCISLQSKRLSRAFSNTTVQKHQFFGTQLSL